MRMSSMTSKEITVPGKATRIRGSTWTHDQVEKLFEVWSEPAIYEALLNEKKKVDIFKRMASMLSSQGVSRKWSEIRAKIKNLKADFRKALEKKSPFKYYEQMKEIMNLTGGSLKTPTKSSTSSFSPEPGPSSRAETSHSGSGPHSSGVESDSDSDDNTGQQRQHSPPEVDIHSHYSDEEEIISNKRSVIQTTFYGHGRHDPLHFRSQVEGNFPDKISQDAPIDYRTQAYLYDSGQEHHTTRSSVPERVQQREEREAYHHIRHPQTPPSYIIPDDYTPEQHDSSSRSSMVISHVISNVIEPVTSIVMPSSSSTSTAPVIDSSIKKSPYRFEETDLAKSPGDPHFPRTPETQPDFHHTQTPVRLLEFVVEDENVILHRTSTDLEQHDHVRQPEAAEVDNFQNSFRTQDESVAPDSPPPLSIVSVDSIATTTPTKAPEARLRHVPGKRETFPRKPPLPISRQPVTQQFPETPKRRTPRTLKVLPPSHPKRKFGRMSGPPQEPTKKRKLLETLNKKTVEVISSLLTESSQSLLKELQDSEQRFIKWEEEKRGEERKREEQMFTKLIAAMRAASGQEHPMSETPTSFVSSANKESTDFVTNLKDVSKRLNDLVSDEVKTTEESMRQWEAKMQRQESRHTEKIFAMLINAIKRPDL